MNKIFFYLLNIINGSVFLLFMVIPKNQYVWMREELGDQHLILPEDSDSLLVINLLAVIIMILSFTNILFFNGMMNKRIRIFLTIVPLLGIVIKLFVIGY